MATDTNVSWTSSVARTRHQCCRTCMKSGASAAEAVVREGNEFSTVVRMGEVETLKESGSRAIGLRVFIGRRAAST